MSVCTAMTTTRRMAPECGKGYSVAEMIAQTEKLTQKSVPHQILPRREGDQAAVYADTEKAQTCLKWQAERTLESMILSQFKAASD